jgi:hypothetical protein
MDIGRKDAAFYSAPRGIRAAPAERNRRRTMRNRQSFASMQHRLLQSEISLRHPFLPEENAV